MKGFQGQELKYNDDFRYISPNEYIEEGTLVWIERFKDAYYNVEVLGPFVIEEGWGPVWFGPKNITALINTPKAQNATISFITMYGKKFTLSPFDFISMPSGLLEP